MKNDKNLDDVDWSFENVNTNVMASNIHPYPAKFIPHIPKNLIEILYSNRGAVLDPMCGSGNTNMVCSNKGIPNYGFDLNPVSTMVSRSKCQQYNDKFKTDIESFLSSIKDTDNITLPDFPDQEKWFRKSVLEKLGKIFYKINTVDNKNQKLFLQVTFSSILKKVSKSNDYRYICDNMYPGRETNSLTPDKKDYDVYKIFKDRCIKNLEMVTSYISETQGKIFNKDSQKMGEEINKPIELTISSPPYVNAVDYARLHRLSFYWFEFPLKETRNKEIGSRSKRGRKNAVQDYFEEMKNVYSNVYNNTIKNGYMCLVVGNSQKNKKEIKTIQKTVDICENIGFTTKKQIPRTISQQSTGNKSITDEKILIFKKE